MVSFYKIGLFSILFLVSVSGVCAVDPDNNTTINNVTVVDESSNLYDSVNNSYLVSDVVDEYVLINNYSYYKNKLSDEYLKSNGTSLFDLKADYDNINRVLDLNYSNVSSNCSEIINNFTFLRNTVYHAFMSKIEANDNLTVDEVNLDKEIFHDWLLRQYAPDKAKKLLDSYYSYYTCYKFQKAIQKKFKDKEIKNVTRDLLFNTCTNETLKTYYKNKLTVLTSNIKTAFDTIDNNINKDFTKLFKNLEVKINLLETKNFKNNITDTVKNRDKTIKLVDNLIKTITHDLVVFRGYNNILNYYLNLLDRYDELSEYSDENIVVDVNNSKKELQLRIDDLNTLSNLFNSMNNDLTYIKNNLDSMIKILKEKSI